MSGVKYYRDLLLQDGRIEAFRRAIASTVRPGDVVLEVGTGLGTFAFFAADAGASRVYAVDGAPIVHVGHAIARANGYGDRVTFIRGWIPGVTIAERADVVILEDFSSRLLDGRMTQLLADLQRDYAVQEARFVPRGARFSLAPVSAHPLWASVTRLGLGEERYGLDWSASREYVTNTPHAVAIPPDALAAPPAPLSEVDFREPHSWRLQGEAVWHLEAARIIHGLALWFDLTLGDHEQLSNAPGAEPGSWGHLFLPLDPPLEFAGGARLTASVGMQRGALWWRCAAGDAERRGHEFRSMPASVQDVTVGSPDYVPALGPRAELERRILSLVDGRRSVRQIAEDPEILAYLGAPGEAERVIARILKDRIPGDDR